MTRPRPSKTRHVRQPAQRILGGTILEGSRLPVPSAFLRIVAFSSAPRCRSNLDRRRVQQVQLLSIASAKRSRGDAERRFRLFCTVTRPASCHSRVIPVSRFERARFNLSVVFSYLSPLLSAGQTLSHLGQSFLSFLMGFVLKCTDSNRAFDSMIDPRRA